PGGPWRNRCSPAVRARAINSTTSSRWMKRSLRGLITSSRRRATVSDSTTLSSGGPGGRGGERNALAAIGQDQFDMLAAGGGGHAGGGGVRGEGLGVEETKTGVVENRRRGRRVVEIREDTAEREGPQQGGQPEGERVIDRHSAGSPVDEGQQAQDDVGRQVA